jgi:ATP-dependent DNA ligase
VVDSETLPTDPLAWRPQYPRPSRHPRAVADPLIEPLWRGTRVLVHVDGSRRGPQGEPWCTILNDEGEDATQQEPAVAAALRGAVRAVDAVIDGYLTDQATRPGETVALLSIGRRTGNIVMGHRVEPDVAPPIDDGTPRPVAFVAVDLLRIDGQDLLDVPLLERKRILDSLLEVGELVRLSPYTRPPVEGWMRSWRAAGFEGVMLKAANSRYRPGSESDEWTVVLAARPRQ